MCDSANEFKSFLLSVVIHIVLFSLVVLFGNFSLPKEKEWVEKPIEVVIYDMDARSIAEVDNALPNDGFAPLLGDGGEGGGGGGGGTPAPLEPLEIPADVGSDRVALPDKIKPLVEDMTTFKKSDFNPAYNPPGDVNREEGGMGYGGTGGGIGGGHGTGIGTGTGSGIGSGEGSGMGGGKGSGYGSGTGSGSGVRPKVAPYLQSAVNPVYPAELRRQNIEGSVRVRIIVGSDGSVENVSVSESSGHEEMDNAAVEAAYKYSFSPAEDENGNAVRCAISATVHFELN